MNEREIIRAITPRLLIAQLESVQCLIADLEETTINGEPLPLSEELKAIHAQLLDLSAQVSRLTDAAACKGSWGNRHPGVELPDAS